MSSLDDVARLREIKRLLDRIQQLPNLLVTPPNGVANGLANGLGMLPPGPPHPTEELEADLDPEPDLDPGLDPIRPPPLEVARRLIPIGPDRALVPVRHHSGGLSPWTFVVATAVNTMVAAVLAVVITLTVARRDPAPASAPAPAEFERMAASAKPAVEIASEPALPREVELMPIGSPAEPLRLEALKPARLPLQVRPEEAMEDGYILLLSGLPSNATLSGATRTGADSWVVSPGGLQRLDLIVPEWSASVAEVGMELRRTNGTVVARAMLWLAVPPPPVPVGAQLDEAAIKELVRTGDRSLARGDVAAARAIYERAAAMGSAQAALALGSTYDPRRLWTLGVFGMVGNKERARQWYQRADELGHPDAKARIGALQER